MYKVTQDEILDGAPRSHGIGPYERELMKLDRMNKEYEESQKNRFKEDPQTYDERMKFLEWAGEGSAMDTPVGELDAEYERIYQKGMEKMGVDPNTPWGRHVASRNRHGNTPELDARAEALGAELRAANPGGIETLLAGPPVMQEPARPRMQAPVDSAPLAAPSLDSPVGMITMADGRRLNPMFLQDPTMVNQALEFSYDYPQSRMP